MVAKAKLGDAEAMNALVEEYQGSVFGFLYQLIGDAESAKEITQDAFVKAFDALASYQESGTFKAWLFRIARNTAMDHLRAKSRRGGDLLELKEEWVGHEQCTQQKVANREECSLAMELVERLPVQEREVMMLRVIENLKFKEIAEVTGAPLNTVLGRMRNGTNRIKTWMQEYQ